MSERLCGGRVVSVAERHCVAAKADSSSQNGLATAMPGETSGDVGGSNDTAGTTSGGGTALGVEGTRETTHEAAVSKGKGKMNVGGSKDEDVGGKGVDGGNESAAQGRASELDCLEGHVRGLRYRTRIA